MVDIFGDDDARETGWDIVSSDTTGPFLPFVGPFSAAVQLHQTGHSCGAQYFVGKIVCARTLLPF